MSNALEIAATGMQTQQIAVETIAHNLSNLNTAGFKKSRVNFVDQMVSAATSNLTGSPLGIVGDHRDPFAVLTAVRGAGVGIAGMLRSFESGELKITDSPFDLAIRGDGFLEVAQADGSTAYWRAGTFKVNSDGQLVSQAGLLLQPGIAIPENAQSIMIEADGRVQVSLPGQHAPVEVGQLQMARFASPGLLEALGDNLYRATPGSGEARSGRPGEEGMGNLAQGQTETSNVRPVDEMVNLMLAQRAFEASRKVMQAADEMSALANNIRK